MNSTDQSKAAGAALVILALLSGCQSNTPGNPSAEQALASEPQDPYARAIALTAAMQGSDEAQRLADKRGLRILDITWEDTARFKDSSVGPNISDMTIQVPHKDSRTGKLKVTAMPVIRYPNFSDKTTDLDPRDFTLLVGNHDGRPLTRVSLFDFLRHPTRYLSKPRSWRGRKPKTLLAERDGKVLVSAQACFLPVPSKGKATFNPVVFNYQSSRKNPAVLTILATREGTSVTIIDNVRDAFSTGSVWGQRLFHNADGRRASLTGTRISEFRGDATSGGSPGAGRSAGMNMVLLIQVPLRHKSPPPAPFADELFLGGGTLAAPSIVPPSPARASDVEAAVIGHGDLEGPFTEIDGLPIERDPRYPVRVTVQFYKATSNGVVDAGDLSEIKREISRVYREGEVVGSLVTGGQTGRVTEYEGVQVQPPDWWADFWRRHQRNTGDTPAEARRKLRRLLGEGYEEKPVCELYLRDLLRHSR